MVKKRDITEEVIHEIWLDEYGNISKTVIREAVTYIFKRMRNAFFERKVIKIDGMGIFYITKGRLRLLERKDKIALDGMEDTKNIG